MGLVNCFLQEQQPQSLERSAACNGHYYTSIGIADSPKYCQEHCQDKARVPVNASYPWDIWARQQKDHGGAARDHSGMGIVLFGHKSFCVKNVSADARWQIEVILSKIVNGSLLNLYIELFILFIWLLIN